MVLTETNPMRCLWSYFYIRLVYDTFVKLQEECYVFLSVHVKELFGIASYFGLTQLG